jgi:hypothetical protein
VIRWQRIALGAEAIVAHPLFAYAVILALQVRVIWKVWDYKDLTSGDTSSYFLDAVTWANELRDDIVWSPLYTNFFGTVSAALGDVSKAVLAHRIVIVLVSTLLVLALMRRMLAPGIALLVAAWWTILPPNFNVEYEVHLFGVWPLLVAALIVSRSQSQAALGAALAVLTASSLLLRNEHVIVTLVFALAIVAREARSGRARRPPFRAYAGAYGVPLLIVCLLFAGAYWRSFDRGDAALDNLHAKHELNLCQVYAFNFQQRHPDQFTGNPFTDCKPLMRRTFGHPLPSLAEALEANPGAVADFVIWNARLLPAGVQVSLFGATSDNVTPGYFPVKKRRSYALGLSVLAAIVLSAGLALARPREWIRRYWALSVVLFGGSATTLVVALTQRPRPEYLYPLTIALMGLTGLSVSVLLQRLGWVRFAGVAAAVMAIGLLIAMPPYYHASARPIYDGLERLQTVRDELRRPNSVLVTTGFGFELCAYTATSVNRFCAAPSWSEIRKHIAAGAPVQKVLAREEATVVYADPLMHLDPLMQPFLAAPRRAGWHKVDDGRDATGEWSVLVRDAR